MIPSNVLRHHLLKDIPQLITDHAVTKQSNDQNLWMALGEVT